MNVPCIDIGRIGALREDLADLPPFESVLSPMALAALARDESVPARAELAEESGSAATAARLFLLFDGVPSSQVDAAFPRCGVAGLVALGLVTIEEAVGERDKREESRKRPLEHAAADPRTRTAEATDVRETAVTVPGCAGGETDLIVTAAVDFAPVEADGTTFWFASDRTGGALAADHVLGVGGASLTLAGITDRSRRRRALDLGTGCGIQAVQLAGHVGDVVVTDLSQRALDFAAFNAALAGQQWDVRRGSLWEPMEGERFDLVVSNPPFVITPASARDAGVPLYEYRDAGRGGDHLLLELLGGLAGHLVTPASREVAGDSDEAAAQTDAREGAAEFRDGRSGESPGRVERDADGTASGGGSAMLLGNWEHRGAADVDSGTGLDAVTDRAALAAPEGGGSRRSDVAAGHEPDHPTTRASAAAPSSIERRSDFRSSQRSSWQDRLGDAAAGLDLWVIEREVLDPAEYVEMWLRDGGTLPGTPEWERAYAAWLADFRWRGVSAIGFGYILARPQSGETPIRRFETIASPASMPIGDHLATCFDAIQRRGEISGLRLRTAPDVSIEHHYEPGASEPRLIVARQGGGFGRVLQLSTAGAGFFSAADGELTAGQIATALEALLDEHGLARRVLSEAATAHEQGFLVVSTG